MNPNQALGNPAISTLASRTLKTVGIIVVLAALLDIILLSMPYQIGDRQWQINFATQVVDRGVVPLVGLVLVVVGFWIDSSLEEGPARGSLWQNPRFYVFALASLLGLFFLLLFPWHLYNMGQAFSTRSAEIQTQATTAKSQLNGRIQAEIESRRSQINQLVGATDEQVSQLEQAGQLTKEQADLVRKFKADPKGIDPFLQEQSRDLTTQGQTQLGTQEQQAKEALELETKKSGLRVGISSLLLAIGYIIMGWTGLRNLRQL